MPNPVVVQTDRCLQIPAKRCRAQSSGGISNEAIDRECGGSDGSIDLGGGDHTVQVGRYGVCRIRWWFRLIGACKSPQKGVGLNLQEELAMKRLIASVVVAMA